MGLRENVHPDADHLDFSLPEIESGLPGEPAKTFRFYLGAPRLGHMDWYGSLYPAKTKKDNHLQEYAKHFNFIELNATFYKPATAQQVLDWVGAVNQYPDFKFCPKFPQHISHIKRLKNALEPTKHFVESCVRFGSRLGPSFLQLSSSFSATNFGALERYIELLPPTFATHVELLHPSWFVEEKLEDVAILFKKFSIGSIYHDLSSRRDLLKMPLTTKTAFIRFQGNNNHPSDKVRLKSWLDRIIEWKGEGLESAYLTINQPSEAAFPKLVDDAKEIFKDFLG